MRLLRGPPYKLWTDLGLEQTGVRLIRPAKQNALPSSDGRTLVVDADLERTLAAIGRLDRADASRFAAFFEEARRLSRRSSSRCGARRRCRLTSWRIISAAAPMAGASTRSPVGAPWT